MTQAPPIIRDLNSEQLAQALGRHKFTIHRWARNGWIPADRRGNHAFYFNLAEVRGAMIVSRLKPGKLKLSKV